MELADFEAARHVALETVSCMMDRDLTAAERHRFVVRLKDGAGQLLYEATLTFEGKRTA